MNIEKRKITDKINLLIFDTKREVASTFVRFQEHYESPQFRGKVFSLEEFQKWYIPNSLNGRKTGKFTYHTDWTGFNVPSYILKPFYGGKFNPLSEQEKIFLELFREDSEPYYIIGTSRKIKDFEGIIKHEAAHGLFYTSPEYKAQVLQIMEKFDTEGIRKELIAKSGYHEDVLQDEVHAWAFASSRDLKTRVPQELVSSLQELYKNYIKSDNLDEIKKDIVI
jgi:hypothetical protein